MKPGAVRELAAHISVVVPAYGRAASLWIAVRSALEQDPPPGEVVVVDDGSTPPLALDPSIASSGRVRLLRHESNRGAATARMTGIRAARGDYIAFLDSDDVWLPGKIASQTPLLPDRVDELVAVACGWNAVDRAGAALRVRFPIPSADPLDFASGCWFAPGATTIVPRRAFELVGAFDPALRRLEDYEWFLRFGLAGGRLDVTPIVGASVSTGRRATLDAVRDAARRIRTTFNGRLEDRMLRRLDAYLMLEIASAAWTETRALQTAACLARSFALVPRVRLHLQQWWRAKPAFAR